MSKLANPRGKGKSKFELIWVQRIHALKKIFKSRYGDTLPDDDAGRDDLMLLVNTYACEKPWSIPRIIRRWAPWADVEEIIAETSPVW